MQKVFLSYQTLYNHKRIDHKKSRHPCDKCEYKATMRCSLKRHNEPVHGTVRYSCDECDYKATQDVSLNGTKNLPTNELDTIVKYASFQPHRNHVCKCISSQLTRK